jgi:hypothetical protein
MDFESGGRRRLLEEPHSRMAAVVGMVADMS